MDFIEQIRTRLRVKKKAQFAMMLRTYPQAYQSLIAARERISLRDLIALRRVSGLSDSALLDEIENELKKNDPHSYRNLPDKK